MYALSRVNSQQKATVQTGGCARGSATAQRAGVRLWGAAHEGGGVYIYIVDSLCCTAETNITLQSNYTLTIK